MNASTLRVGFLGTGLMGSAMARRLLSQGFPVLAWDRNTAHARAVAEAGGEALSSAAEVVASAEVVITMLPTADIVLAVVQPLLDDWPEGTIWLQMSSVGATEADRLAAIAAEHGITQIDAPVSGSTTPAEQGTLTILASGPDSARDSVASVLSALGSRVEWVGPAGHGSRLKLAANHWMVGMVAVLAETMQLCELLGVDQRRFFDLLDGGPLGSSYALQKLDEMRHHDYPAGFPVRLAVKDLELVREVCDQRGVDLPLLDAVLERMSAAQRSHADEDLAAVYEVPVAAGG